MKARTARWPLEVQTATWCRDSARSAASRHRSPVPTCAATARTSASSRIGSCRVKTGDVLVKHSSGGGGVGNPAERDPELVREDVENEFVSLENAKEIYRVVIEPDTLKVDHQATKALRAK